MNTEFIGFRTTSNQDTVDNIYGICNEIKENSISLFYEIVNSFNQLSKEDINDIYEIITWEEYGFNEFNKLESLLKANTFLNRVFKNEREVFEYSKCRYAFIFNLENDTLEIHKGYCENPQYQNQKANMLGNKKYYLNKFIEITRKFDIARVLEVLEHDYLTEKYKQNNFISENKELKVNINIPNLTINNDDFTVFNPILN